MLIRLYPLHQQSPNLTIIHRERRQEVPDTQEVFRYNQSDAIIVVEIIARVELTDNQEAIRYVNLKLAGALMHWLLSCVTDSSSTN